MRVRLVPVARDDGRRIFLSYLLRRAPVRASTVGGVTELEVAEELLPELCRLARSFGLEVHRGPTG
jgi:hypothetical protein